MKVILTDLDILEFFENGGAAVLTDGRTLTDGHEFADLDDETVKGCTGSIGINHYLYDSKKHEFKYRDLTDFLSPRDPYGIQNVNFSLIDERDKRWEDFKRQRVERGFDESETWALDSTIAKFILPRLTEFRECTCGYPGFMDSADEWHDVLNKMIDAFELLAKDDKPIVWPEDEREVIDEGLKLFAEYFESLWW